MGDQARSQEEGYWGWVWGLDRDQELLKTENSSISPYSLQNTKLIPSSISSPCRLLPPLEFTSSLLTFPRRAGQTVLD